MKKLCTNLCALILTSCNHQTSNKTRVVATVALATQCQGGNKQGYQAYCQTDRHQTLRCNDVIWDKKRNFNTLPLSLAHHISLSLS